MISHPQQLFKVKPQKSEMEKRGADSRPERVVF